MKYAIGLNTESSFELMTRTVQTMSLTIIPTTCVHDVAPSDFNFQLISVNYIDLPHTIVLNAQSLGYCEYTVEAREYDGMWTSNNPLFTTTQAEFETFLGQNNLFVET